MAVDVRRVIGTTSTGVVLTGTKSELSRARFVRQNGRYYIIRFISYLCISNCEFIDSVEMRTRKDSSLTAIQDRINENPKIFKKKMDVNTHSFKLWCLICQKFISEKKSHVWANKSEGNKGHPFSTSHILKAGLREDAIQKGVIEVLEKLSTDDASYLENIGAKSLSASNHLREFFPPIRLEEFEYVHFDRDAIYTILRNANVYYLLETMKENKFNVDEFD